MHSVVLTVSDLWRARNATRQRTIIWRSPAACSLRHRLLSPLQNPVVSCYYIFFNFLLCVVVGGSLFCMCVCDRGGECECVYVCACTLVCVCACVVLI
jgi:hypothetical protein